MEEEVQLATIEFKIPKPVSDRIAVLGRKISKTPNEVCEQLVHAFLAGKLVYREEEATKPPRPGTLPADYGLDPEPTCKSCGKGKVHRATNRCRKCLARSGS